MRRPFLLSAVLAWSMLLRGEACGSEVGNKEVGEPCTRDSECRDELVCTAGTCRAPRGDAGAARDAAIADAGPSGG